jgi:hypothetical protein
MFTVKLVTAMRSMTLPVPGIMAASSHWQVFHSGVDAPAGPGRRPNLDSEFKFNSLAMISDSAWQLQVELEFLKFKFGIPVMVTPA